MNGDDQIIFTHYILEKARDLIWDAEMKGPCKNKEFMDQLKSIAAQIEEAHRLLGGIKE